MGDDPRAPYAEHPETEFVACCEPNPKQLARFAARWGSHLRTYDDLTAMLDGERLGLDMVSVCAPSGAHAEILQALLDAPRSKVIVLREAPRGEALAVRGRDQPPQ